MYVNSRHLYSLSSCRVCEWIHLYVNMHTRTYLQWQHRRRSSRYRLGEVGQDIENIIWGLQAQAWLTMALCDCPDASLFPGLCWVQVSHWGSAEPPAEGNRMGRSSKPTQQCQSCARFAGTKKHSEYVQIAHHPFPFFMVKAAQKALDIFHLYIGRQQYPLQS